MRILVATRGIDRSECRLYIGLKEAGLAVDVLCPPGAAHQDRLAAAGVPVAHFEARHRLDRAAVRDMRQRLASPGYDLVYASDNAALAVTLQAARRAPVRVVGYRGTTGHLHPWDPGSRLTYLNRRLDHIVCVSHAVEAFLRDRMHLPGTRLTTIYKGHDPEWYPPPPPIERAALGLPPDAFVVTFAGRLRPVKGGAVLLDAMALLASACPRVHLLLIGDITDRRVRRRLRQPARLRGRVHCTGYRRDADRLVGASDLFVMPSLDREGLPRAVIEAMAHRRPVVVTRVGGLPELVVDGENGRLVPPHDAPALAQAIRFFAESPDECAACGQRGRQRMAHLFHVEQTLRRTHRLFTDLVR